MFALDRQVRMFLLDLPARYSFRNGLDLPARYSFHNGLDLPARFSFSNISA